MTEESTSANRNSYRVRNENILPNEIVLIESARALVTASLSPGVLTTVTASLSPGVLTTIKRVMRLTCLPKTLD